MINNQLFDYIKQQLQENKSREEIERSLVEKGWNEQEVNAALESLGPTQPKTKTRFLYLRVGIALITALALTLLLLAGKQKGHEESPKIDTKQPTTIKSPVTISNFRGDVKSGETKQHTFLVDAGPSAQFIVMTPDSDLKMVIYDPDGMRIDPRVADTDSSVEYGKEDTGEGGKYTWYIVQNPAPGKWQVEIAATTGGEYIMSVEIESDVSLVVSADKGSYGVGKDIQIKATFRDGDVPIIGANVIAEIWKPDQSVDKITLYDDGTHGDDTPNDGVYFNIYPGSSTSGYIDINVTAATASIARTAERHIVVTPGTARLTGVYNEEPIDSDADGLYDVLRIDVEVDIVTVGHYEIAGYLEKDPLKPAIAYVEYNTQLQDTGQLSAGRQYISLEFDGEHIRASRFDGPYQVRVILYDQSDASIEVDTNAGAPYITEKYAADRFQD